MQPDLNIPARKRPLHPACPCGESISWQQFHQSGLCFDCRKSLAQATQAREAA